MKQSLLALACDRCSPLWHVRAAVRAGPPIPLLLCSLLACDGTDTGNPFDASGSDDVETPGGGVDCDATESDVEAGQSTELGFSAQEVVDLVSGERRASLLWLESPKVEYGPETGESEIRLTVEVVGSPRFIDREPRPPGAGSETELPIYAPACNDSIELDLRIGVVTAGGALDEIAETTAIASARDFAVTGFSLSLDSLMGSFEAKVEPPPNAEFTVPVPLSVRLGFTEYGLLGSMNMGGEFRALDGSVGAATYGDIARFPADDYCGPDTIGVAADQSVRGLSIASALEPLNAMSPVQLRYDGGDSAELALSFSNAEPRVCVSLGVAGGISLEFPGVVTLMSTDGRVDGNVPVQFSVEAAEGVPASISVQGSLQADDPSQAASPPAQFGIRDALHFSGYDGGRVEFLGVASGGSLRVYALDVAECVTNPPPRDPNATSHPGCRGTDRIPLWGARWGNVE